MIVHFFLKEIQLASLYLHSPGAMHYFFVVEILLSSTKDDFHTSRVQMYGELVGFVLFPFQQF